MRLDELCKTEPRRNRLGRRSQPYIEITDLTLSSHASVPFHFFRRSEMAHGHVRPDPLLDYNTWIFATRHGRLHSLYDSEASSHAPRSIGSQISSASSTFRGGIHTPKLALLFTNRPPRQPWQSYIQTVRLDELCKTEPRRNRLGQQPRPYTKIADLTSLSHASVPFHFFRRSEMAHSHVRPDPPHATGEMVTYPCIGLQG